MKKCCKTCDYVGRSGGGFFYECLSHGFQINDETTECCDEYKEDKTTTKGMTKKEAYELAKLAKKTCTTFNNVYDEIAFDLYEFEVDGEELRVFAYIRKEMDEVNNHKYYAVYDGVEYEGGDTIYSCYDHSTENMTLKELADALYEIANYYKSSEAIEELRKMMQGSEE